MPMPDIRFRTYLKAFFSDMLTRMSGPLSVPFAVAATLGVEPHSENSLRMSHSCPTRRYDLWWELFSVARTAIGGWLPFALHSLTVMLAIIVTLRCTRPKAKSAAAIG